MRDATRSERGWNYLGSWLHWLYMFRGGAWDAWWALIIDTLAALGCVAVLTGAAVGIWRWRFGQPYRTGRRTPFPQPMMRWHHVSGMLFALAACAWVFSGLMSMNPLGVFSSQAEPLQIKALQGGPLLPGRAGEWAAPQALLAAVSSADSRAAPVRELRWQPALGRTLALAFDSQRPGAPRVLDARTAAPLDLPASEVQQAAARLLSAPVAQAQMLTAYDFYYYPRADHTMTGGHANRPLPVLRLVFDDEHASWVYVDPRTAQMLERTDRASRASRWLFTLLHSWDWLPLVGRLHAGSEPGRRGPEPDGRGHRRAPPGAESAAGARLERQGAQGGQLIGNGAPRRFLACQASPETGANLRGSKMPLAQFPLGRHAMNRRAK